MKTTPCGLIDAGTVNVFDPLTLAVPPRPTPESINESESPTLPEPPPAETLTPASVNGKAGAVADKS